MLRTHGQVVCPCNEQYQTNSRRSTVLESRMQTYWRRSGKPTWRMLQTVVDNLTARFQFPEVVVQLSDEPGVNG